MVDLFASIDKGIYGKKIGGSSVGATGELNCGIDEAYLTENRKLYKPLKGAISISKATDVDEQDCHVYR